ncbi:MAG: OmpA family protein [Acidobacteria bacterium]|nr:OmpA family protein [Acidobacteriota bacterium]
MQRKRSLALITLSLSLVLLAAGCKKKEPPPPPPPPPPAPTSGPAPARPTISISAEPSSIERGKSATLKWTSSNADSASLNQGIGTVQTSGSREVFPTQTTRYTIEVKGPGGTASASAEVTVRTPPPPPAPSAPDKTFSQLINERIRDAYFDYDKSTIRPDAEDALRSDATALKDIFGKFPSDRVTVEGHCDDRGTNEYNLALGDRRATAARDFLVNLGVPATKLSTVSYGEERPQCTEETDACWQRNRRAHFAASN